VGVSKWGNFGGYRYCFQFRFAVSDRGFGCQFGFIIRGCTKKKLSKKERGGFFTPCSLTVDIDEQQEYQVFATLEIPEAVQVQV